MFAGPVISIASIEQMLLRQLLSTEPLGASRGTPVVGREDGRSQRTLFEDARLSRAKKILAVPPPSVAMSRVVSS